MAHVPLFIRSLERVGSSLRFLDQTALPGTTRFVETSDYTRIIEAIRKLEIRGAPAIGIAAAYGVAVAVAHKGDYSVDFASQMCGEFAEARPTAVNLSIAMHRMESRYRESHPESLQDALTLLWSEAEAIHREDREMCERIASFGVELIPDTARILTHCHTGAIATGGIGTALGIIHAAHASGKEVTVYADETRPLLQGSRLTSWELMAAGIPVTLICDSMAAVVIRDKHIDLVLVGADRITRNGDIANKIGTYGLAVLAEAHGVPFYVAAPMTTFDDTLESGNDIPIEERSREEITRGFGTLTAPADVSVYAPAFDVTPARLITAIITDAGIRPGGRK